MRVHGRLLYVFVVALLVVPAAAFACTKSGDEKSGGAEKSGGSGQTDAYVQSVVYGSARSTPDPPRSNPGADSGAGAATGVGTGVVAGTGTRTDTVAGRGVVAGTGTRTDTVAGTHAATGTGTRAGAVVAGGDMGAHKDSETAVRTSARMHMDLRPERRRTRRALGRRPCLPSRAPTRARTPTSRARAIA
jgi:hypothetical protein